MANVDKKYIEKKFWWYRFWQYVVAVLLFISVPVILSYACWIFQLPTNAYYFVGAFFIFQVVMLYFSPKLMLNLIASYPDKYQKVTLQDHPQFYKALAQLAEKFKIEMPDVYIIDSETANAFALKIFGGKYISCITKKLMNLLDEKEQEAVMAHEFAHIANDDVKLSMYIAVFNILQTAISNQILSLVVQRGIQKTEEMKKQEQGEKSPETPAKSLAQTSKELPLQAIFYSANVAYKILTYAPYLIALLSSRVSQQKEYRADACAAYVLNNTAKMKSALIALQKHSERLPMFPASLNPLFALPIAYHFFIWPLFLFPTFRDEKDALEEPTWGRRLRNLLESHPLTYDRIKRLESYEE